MPPAGRIGAVDEAVWREFAISEGDEAIGVSAVIGSVEDATDSQNVHQHAALGLVAFEQAEMAWRLCDCRLGGQPAEDLEYCATKLLVIRGDFEPRCPDELLEVECDVPDVIASDTAPRRTAARMVCSSGQSGPSRQPEENQNVSSSGRTLLGDAS